MLEEKSFLRLLWKEVVSEMLSLMTNLCLFVDVGSSACRLDHSICAIESHGTSRYTNGEGTFISTRANCLQIGRTCEVFAHLVFAQPQRQQHSRKALTFTLRTPATSLFAKRKSFDRTEVPRRVMEPGTDKRM